MARSLRSLCSISRRLDPLVEPSIAASFNNSDFSSVARCSTVRRPSACDASFLSRRTRRGSWRPQTCESSHGSQRNEIGGWGQLLGGWPGRCGYVSQEFDQPLDRGSAVFDRSALVVGERNFGHHALEIVPCFQLAELVEPARF